MPNADRGRYDMATGWTVRTSNPVGVEIFHARLDRLWDPITRPHLASMLIMGTAVLLVPSCLPPVACYGVAFSFTFAERKRVCPCGRFVSASHNTLRFSKTAVSTSCLALSPSLHKPSSSYFHDICTCYNSCQVAVLVKFIPFCCRISRDTSYFLTSSVKISLL